MSDSFRRARTEKFEAIAYEQTFSIFDFDQIQVVNVCVFLLWGLL
jgi:hypothetical protein